MNNTSLIPANARSSSDDNLIPLINIVFLLLIFFMVAGQIKTQTSADLQLPQSSALPASQDQSHQLLMSANQQLRLDQSAITLEQLPDLIAPTDSLAIMLDRQLTAGQIQPLIDSLRQLHITRIQLFTEQVDP